MEQVTRGNGTVTSYSYDIRGRLDNLVTTAGENLNYAQVQNVNYKFRVDNSVSQVINNTTVDTDGANLSLIHI